MTPSFTVDALLAAIIAVIAGHVAIQRRAGRWIALEPVVGFWAGSVVIYVMQPLQHARLFMAWRADGVIELTLAWILLAMLCVLAGYEARLGVRWGARLPRMPARLHPDRMFWTAVVLIALGMAGYAYVFASAGGLETWLQTGRGGTDYQNTSAYITQLTDVLPVGVTVLLFHVSLHRVTRLKRILTWAGAAMMLVWFVYLGTRSRTIAFTMVLLGAYYLPKRKAPSVRLLIPAGLALLVVTNFQAHYRDRFRNLSIFEDVDLAEAAAVSLPPLLGGSESEAARRVSTGIEFNCVAAVVELVPDFIPYNLGYPELELMTRVVPRSVWPDKIYPTYQAYTPIFRMANLSNTVIPTAREELLMGPSFTFVGHWYSVGGPLAVALAGFFTGAALRALRVLHDRRPGSQGDLLLFASLIPLGFGEVSGTPLFFIFSLPFTLGPVLMLLAICKVPERVASMAVGVAARP